MAKLRKEREKIAFPPIEENSKMPSQQLPLFHKEKFKCPNCKVFAKQEWTDAGKLSVNFIWTVKQSYLNYRENFPDYVQSTVKEFCEILNNSLTKHVDNLIAKKLSFSVCQSCSETSVWHNKEMIYPRLTPFSDPNEDMNDEIQQYYREAALIYKDSPRASAALLRLCVEKLCRQLGEKGDLNQCISNMVKNKELSHQIQQALDYCRVIGNNAVHPGEIEIEEDTDQVSSLFSLINDIAYEMLTKPKELNEKYSSLPPKSLQQIQNRDK